ncbi:unnamed protein product [marine sediment metagenome]|uniref:Uncharacterized protein n=1 Tax=marine sediment metagenome TaxID=412755 RepID=X1HM12_9ZZZZ
MTRKAKADIYYDEILPSPFYGVNAIEAGAFKMAVICNMNKYARKYMQERKLRCPFIVCATEPELKRQLKRLVLNKQFRKERGEASFQYVKKVHTPKVCVNRFLKLIKG